MLQTELVRNSAILNNFSRNLLLMTDTLYLVDTFSLMFQVFHAIRQPMTGAGGQPTNAVYGFTTDLRYLRNDVKPTHLVCALESTEPGERSKLYPEYKAHRAEMPEDLRPQVAVDHQGHQGV